MNWLKSPMPLVLASVVAGSLAWTAEAHERSVPRAELPQAVQDTLAKDYQGATFRHASLETEDGVTADEVKVIDHGSAIELDITPDGRLTATEQSLPLAQLPPAVSQAAKDRFPGASQQKATLVTRDGKTYYEVALTDGGRRFEATFDAAGAFQAQEAGDDD